MLFSSNSLERSIRDLDLDNSVAYQGNDAKKNLALDAAAVAASGFAALNLKSISVRKKIAYSVDDLPTLIVLRRLNSIITRSTNVRTADRDTIIRRLATILGEGVIHRVYKFDIRSFFESIDNIHLIQEIDSDQRIPRLAVDLLRKFVSKIADLQIPGVARGVPLSATLAEYSMQNFDSAISKSPHVYFYARYVDDIIIVTGARERERAFVKFVNKNLPSGLKFNHEKCSRMSLGVNKGGTGANILGRLEYLGYEFVIHETAVVSKKMKRGVEVRFANKKLNRLKSRICRSFIAYCEEKDIDLLVERIKLLSGNYNLRDRITKQVRNAGLYCNYRRVTDTSQLDEVDRFFKSLAFGNKSRISKKIRSIMPKVEQDTIAPFNFRQSFKSKTFYNFTHSEMKSLSQCWQNA